MNNDINKKRKKGSAGNIPGANNAARPGGPRTAARDRGRGRGPGGGKGPRRRGLAPGSEAAEEFEQRILDIARVTRVMAGGKRMRFRACVALGNKKGKVGVGLAKGADVTMAVTKAVNQAKKVIIDIPIVNDTIPHEIYHKYGAAKIIFKPAGKGRGVIAGGVVRVILDLAGVKNITSKILGTNNKVNNAKCVVAALASLRKIEKKEKEKGIAPAAGPESAAARQDTPAPKSE